MHTVDIMIVRKCKSHLFQIVATLRPPRGFACPLDGRKKQRHKHGNDRNYNQQFNQREAGCTRLGTSFAKRQTDSV